MNKSPHLIIGKSFHLIRENSLILVQQKSPTHKEDTKKTLNYDILYIGKNVMISQKVTQYMNLKLERTKQNCVYILCQYTKDFTMDNVILYTEMGTLIQSNKQLPLGNSYVLLAIIQLDMKWKSLPILLDKTDIQLIKKVSYNQVKKNSSYHFDTKGYLYGFGYGVKYEINEEKKYSYGRYSYSKSYFVNNWDVYRQTYTNL